jgi:hypothetical protein
MDDYLADPPRTGPTPADKASNWAIGAAIASIVCAGAGAGLAVNLGLGLPPLLVGKLGWLVAWAVGMGLAIGALRNAYSSATPGEVRKKGWGAIGISAFSLMLVIVYLFALVIAAQRIVDGA